MHITSGKKLHEIVDDENQLFAVDYRPDGALFATAGKDKIVSAQKLHVGSDCGSFSRYAFMTKPQRH